MALTKREIDEALLGYNHTAENLATLMGRANLDSGQVVQLVGAADVDSFLEYDVLAANTICENQGRENSCGGNSLSTGVEFLVNRINGVYTQLSRQCAYIWGQGRPSGDNGMSIEGGVAVATEKGLPPEELWPYPNPAYYMTSPPKGVTQAQILEAAKPYKIDGVSWCKDYTSGDAHMAGGQGVVYIGIPWRSSMASGPDVIEAFSGGFGGWHALVFLARSPRRDNKGRRYWWLANSHGPNWGNRGLAEVSPAAIEAMFRDGARMCGLSDTRQPVIREWNYKLNRVTH